MLGHKRSESMLGHKWESKSENMLGHKWESMLACKRANMRVKKYMRRLKNLKDICLRSNDITNPINTL